MAETAVIGRDDELGSIEAFLAGIEQGPRALVLAGEAGVGKTILWEAGVEEAEQRFGCVLAHQSAEAEALLSFTGLSDLLSPVFDEVAPLLATPRRRALEVALLLTEPGEEAPDPRAIGLAFLDVLRTLAQRGPLLLALDDVHWLDPSSGGVLQIALRRLRDEPLGLLMTLRETPKTHVLFEAERVFPESRLDRLSLRPLSLGALHHLLRDRLGLELTRPELTRVEEMSSGNPFFALELGRELVRTNARLASRRVLRVPESLHDLLGGRLARLPPETVELLRLASALARPTVELLAATTGDQKDVLERLDVAVKEGVVKLDEFRIRFVHPMLGSICYEQASIWERREVHRALAAAVTDTEERARHLALAAEGPDAAAASYLETAADQAAARGATAAAAELAELAAGLTPGGPELVRRRRFRAASFHRLAGDPERAAGILEQLLVDCPPGLERADVLFELASTLRADTHTLIELFDQALRAAAGDDVRAMRILGLRSGIHMWEPDMDAALADGRAALEKAERVGDPAMLAVAIARLGQVETYAAEITPGLLERGAEIEERLGLVLEYSSSPRYALARLLMRRGEIDGPRAVLEELESKASARGDEGTRLMVLWTLSLLEWLAGRWSLALGHATVAQELVEQTQHPHARVWVGRVKATLEADLGLVEQARASAEEGLAFSQGTSNETFTIYALGSLGRLELALGNLEAAAGHLRELPGRLLAGGVVDPTQPVWADAIEAMIAVGEPKQARTYLEQHELHAERLGSPLAVATGARCRGLLAAAEGDLPAAFTAFVRSLAELEEVPYPLERGRTLLCLGVVRRKAQQKTAARETLEEALAIFEELGARLWADKARSELKRISGRQPSSDGLTETETQVATLAAQGRSNKQIAAALFMGVSTVEAHLSHVYRKLGIRSRTELGPRLAMARDEADQS